MAELPTIPAKGYYFPASRFAGEFEREAWLWFIQVYRRQCAAHGFAPNVALCRLYRGFAVRHLFYLKISLPLFP